MDVTNKVVICHATRSISSQGMWLGDNPVKFMGPLFMIEIAVAAFVTGTANHFLRRFGFSSFFSCLLASVIINPIFFKEFIICYQSQYMFEVFRYMANVFYPFLVGLKMDFRMARGSGRKAALIGISVGLLPMFVSYLTAAILNRRLNYKPEEFDAVLLCSVAVLGSQTSFHDVACVLSDLKLLNSEVGRLSIASTIISNSCSFAVMIVLSALQQAREFGGKSTGLFYFGSIVCFVVFIVYVSKPISLWMMKQVPPGSKNIKEVHVFMVFVMVLATSFIGQSLGHSAGFGPLVVGLMIPPGPPLAESIEEKLEFIVAWVFLPLFYVASSGVQNDDQNKFRIMLAMSILVLGFVLKVIGTIIPALYSGMLFNDSFVLGLIMASPGIMDLIILRSSLRYGHINSEVYNMWIYFLVVVAGFTSAMVKLLYKPSTDHFVYKRRTQGNNTDDNTDFRILSCIYRDFNVPSTIHLIEALNATEDNPINIYLLHIIKIRRVAPPLIISYKDTAHYSIHFNRSEHIINAFRHFQQQHKKVMSLKSFSALSPCATVHRDICSLAIDTKVDLVILPFHKQFNVDGIMESVAAIQNVNVSVLKVSPCPVGILIDRRRVDCDNSSVAQIKPFFHIALIFLGGADDREVLNLGMRMAENPSIALTVIRYSISGDSNDHLEQDEKLDEALLYLFQKKYVNMEGIVYKEQVVPNGLGVVRAMREVEDEFDLIMVGRQHPKESERFKGLSEWNEHPELGIMGDILASSKLHEDIPLLVLQQKYTLSDV